MFNFDVFNIFFSYIMIRETAYVNIMENRVNYDYKQKITNKERNADKNLA